MAVLYIPHFVEFLDDNGDPLANGKLYSYAAGTNTPKDTFTTAAGTIANPNPVILDANGRAIVFIDGSYKFELRDANDVIIRTTDNVTSYQPSSFSSGGQFNIAAGSASLPGLAFVSDTNTGIWQSASDNIDFATGGVNRLNLNNSNATFTTNLNVPSINTGQIAGFRNKIINGRMDLARRNTTFTSVSSGTNTLDNWLVEYVSSVVGNITQQADAPSSNEFQNSQRFTVTTADSSIAAGDYFVLRQFIEGFNVRDLIGRTFTIGLWIRSAVTGVHCVSVSNSGNDRSYVTEVTINAANTWEFKSVTVTGGLITAGTWNWTNGTGLRVSVCFAAGSTFQTTAGAWQTGNFFATANQVNAIGTNSNVIAITGVQLEIGSNATPFEHRDIGTELRMAERYLPAFYGAAASISIICPAFIQSATVAIANFPLRTEPRIAPTGLTVSAAGDFLINQNASNVTPSSISFTQSSLVGVRISVGASGMTANAGGDFLTQNTNAKILFTGAQLT